MVWSEQLGFDEVWLTEHHFIDYGLSVDPTTLASAVALLDRWGVSRQIYVAPTDAQALFATIIVTCLLGIIVFGVISIAASLTTRKWYEPAGTITSE